MARIMIDYKGEEHILSNRLKELRVSRGLSQKQLGEASGVSYRLIQSYEQDHRDLHEASYSKVEALAKALGVYPHELF